MPASASPIAIAQDFRLWLGTIGQAAGESAPLGRRPKVKLNSETGTVAAAAATGGEKSRAVS